MSHIGGASSDEEDVRDAVDGFRGVSSGHGWDDVDLADGEKGEEEKGQERLEQDAQTAAKWPQLMAAVATCIGALGLGCGMGWTSPVLPVLTECEDNPEKPEGCAFDEEFTVNEGSWIGATYTLGALVSGLATGVLLAKVGRKWTMLLMAVPYVSGWLLLTLTGPLNLADPAWFYTGRVLSGFGAGSFALAAPIYISEIAETSLRGSLGSMMQLFLTTGIVYINGMGSVLEWDVLTATVLLFPVLMAVSMFFMPESPYFLITRGKENQARKALQWLRGKEYNIEGDMSAMQKTFADQQALGKITVLEIFTKPVYLKPMLLMLSLMFFQQFCGINAIVFYLTDIFLKAGFNIQNSLLEAAVVSCTQVLATGTAILVVERVGRKVLLVLSSSVMCVAIFALGLFFYFEENQEVICSGDVSGTTPSSLSKNLTMLSIGTTDLLPTTTEVCIPKDGFSTEMVDSLGWLPMVSLIVYKFFFSIGYGPLPWMMNGEFFPLEAKGTSSAISTAFNWTCAFLVTKYTVKLEDAIGIDGTYFLFSAVCFVATIWVIFLIPETRGKSPDDMKRHFMGEKKEKETTPETMDPEEHTSKSPS